jgi:hypothetical protein
MMTVTKEADKEAFQSVKIRQRLFEGYDRRSAMGAVSRRCRS